MEPPSKDNKNGITKGNIFVLVLLSVIVVGFYFSTFNGPLSTNIEDWSGFGEYVGGILGTILSLIALIVVVKTYNLQAEELKLTRQELKGSKKALEGQIEESKLQRLETTFFSLLREKNAFLNSRQGNETFRIWVKNKFADFHRQLKSKKTSEDETVKRIRSEYLKIHNNHIKNILAINDSMFRLIYESNFTANEKYIYYQILINSMADGEGELYTAYTLANQFPREGYAAIDDSSFFKNVQTISQWEEYKDLIESYLSVNNLI